MRQFLIIVVVIFFTDHFVVAQVGIGTTNPDPSAMMDIRPVGNHKGILIPRVTQSEKNQISTPATGLLLYQTDGTSGFYYHNGSNWKLINPNVTDGATGPAGPQGPTGSQGPQGPAGPQGPPGVSSTNTDSQTLSISGNVLSITSGNSVTLSLSSTDSQTIAAVLSGTVLQLLPENTTTSTTIDLSSINSTNTLEQVTAVGSITSSGITVSGTLIINDDIKVGERIYHLGDDNTYIQYIPDDIRFVVGGFDTLKSLPGETNINAGGADMDFRIATDTETNTFFVKGSTDKVGIGTNSPTNKLEVVGTISSTGLIDTSLGSQNEVLFVGPGKQISSSPSVTITSSGELVVTNVVSATNIRISGTLTTTSNLFVAGDTRLEGDLTTTDADIVFEDTDGSFPTNGKGFFWKLNNDKAKIYAQQPSSDKINFVFYLDDNAGNNNDKYIFYNRDHNGDANSRYPLTMSGRNFYVYAPPSGTPGEPSLTSWAMRVEPNGNVDISGNLTLDGSGTVGGSNITSDLRLKSNIVESTLGIDQIMQLKPKIYDKYKTPKKNSLVSVETGFIAQEVNKVIPLLVHKGNDENNILSLNYTGLIPVLTKAIQEQQKLILELQKNLENISRELDKIKTIKND